MIARLAASAALTRLYRSFLDSLTACGFQGEISPDYGNRTVLATDNSIYQRLPQAALFPLHDEDVQRIATLAAQPEYRDIVLTPRGGGTGTNGQSLTHGLVVDLSRHMNRILEINAEERWVRVQAGVVKDQLNAALKPHGLFFAPELSTSNRATLGGMINTDASGQGSCTYGKTRDHVLTLDSILLGGQRLKSGPVSDQELAVLAASAGRLGEVHRTVRDVQREHAGLIEARFPKLNRCLTGYDLAHIRGTDGRFNLNNILCGSEGSLGFIVEAKLNVLPIPKHSVLVNVSYTSFMDALRDAQALMAMAPLSIETVDSKVLGLAMKDIVWHDVADYFPADPSVPTLGINLVEFSGDDADTLDAQVASFVEHLKRDAGVRRICHTLARGSAAIAKVNAMRKRAVGLLGNVQGEVRPQPFVEDTAVPPEALADFIAEFRALLDGFNLQYGMFGHVDAGVLHVRPALDMKDPAQAALVRPITDGVARLTQKYGGLLWGEHGKGLRSEYAPTFFGELYPALQAIKSAFDPFNQLNPGKIATPLGSRDELLKIDEVTLRGDLDRQIDERVWRSYESAVHCNGNGACYNYDPNDAMCPSWKATRERTQSPKGRASLIREWLRLQGQSGVDVLQATRDIRTASPLRGLLAKVSNTLGKRWGEQDFSHEVFEAMSGCLACKSCAGQCPVKVNVPEFRSRFLELYHSRYLRPLKDYLIGSLEFSIPYFAKTPSVYNGLMRLGATRAFLKHYAGMVDSPLLSRTDLAPTLKRWNVEAASPEKLRGLSDQQRARSVILVQDAFTRYFETEVLADLIEVLSRLGFKVLLAPYLPNGKPLQVLGFIGAFEKAARKNASMLNGLGGQGVKLVGLDPAMTLVYRQEYRKLLGDQAPDVLLPQEWLIQALDVSPHPAPAAGDDYYLLGHCTEKTNAPAATALWPEVFRRLGLNLRIVSVGCCGMSGTYGHEAANRDTSEKIYDLSWRGIVEGPAGNPRLLANGYSCRSQAERLSGIELSHPIQALLKRIAAT
ncbi:D-2-hydroxyglutarate dehydrogenase YdiJ [Pseudomonas sp. TCU-HL1]|uniref:D-2-hydroxyglutarate dehydrogenase YdiJ n=1 Tax=Pseudomonas sp. TCU-HL1 TaxID=1856685 RepID=UPI00083DBA51|nr:FAD-binding and (Fe-S)-binding domain-containing protein [Pseudomonas sp. TCU-HL1]AOE85290.1 glycolate dehydrogenase [Pseudomonas sp. TCU-HL1]